MAASPFMVKESALGEVQSLSLASAVSWLVTGSRFYGLNVPPDDRSWVFWFESGVSPWCLGVTV